MPSHGMRFCVIAIVIVVILPLQAVIASDVITYLENQLHLQNEKIESLAFDVAGDAVIAGYADGTIRLIS